MRSLQLKCSMCLRKFHWSSPKAGRPPRHCPECRQRLKAEQARVNMARMRARRRLLGQADAVREKAQQEECTTTTAVA